MTPLLARILCSAAHSMWRNDPTLGQYTSETCQHELNLAFHYASELRDWVPWLDCDFDVSKKSCNHERPDIVLHRRKTHALNFLVIEIKRARYRGNVPADLNQIRERWFEDHFRYRFAAAVILEDDKPEFEVQVLGRDEKFVEPVVLAHSDMGAPLPKPSAERIRAAKAAAAETEESALVQDINELVCALYGLTKEEMALVEAAAK
jgi:hypothetical protein